MIDATPHVITESRIEIGDPSTCMRSSVGIDASILLQIRTNRIDAPRPIAPGWR